MESALARLDTSSIPVQDTFPTVERPHSEELPYLTDVNSLIDFFLDLLAYR